MALFKIEKGLAANLTKNRTNTTEGYCYFTTDDGKMYIDTNTKTNDTSGRVAINGTNYAVCSTEAGTAGKVANVPGFILYTGAQVTIKFTYANSAANPTLNISNTGVKPICIYGDSAIGTDWTTNSWVAGAVQTFIYDGANWVREYWYNTTYHVEVPEPQCSTASTTADKVAYCSYYDLDTNRIFHLMLSVPNTAASALTLNINGRGAKPIYINGEATSSSNYTLTAGTYLVIYNGTYYNIRTDNGTMVGATASADGATGLVPAPSAGDQSKFLRADGTWQVAGAVTGVKGNAETSYRTGDINLTAANVGALPLTGGTLTGDLNVENGNVTIQSTTNHDAVLWVNSDAGSLGLYSNGSADGYDSRGLVGIDSSGNTKTIYWINSAGQTWFPQTMNLYSDTRAGEGGEIHLAASSLSPEENGIILDQYYGYFRVFGIPSADGTTNTGIGKIFRMSPYTQTIEASGYTMTASKVYGAVWNDYAEYRQLNSAVQTAIKPGTVVIENGDDTLSPSIDRLQPAGNVVSDTFGFAIGETEKAKLPLAVAGRVLVYPYEDRQSYSAGDAVCTAPDGKVSKMTREEIKEYPDRIVGYVSAVPEYETWGEDNVAVDGRIWIKVK